MNTKVQLNLIPDSLQNNSLKMVVRVDRGPRVKIKEIAIEGNEIFSDLRLRKQLKNTKQKFTGRFWKKSKYIPADFSSDKEELINFFKEKGTRHVCRHTHNE